MADNDHLSAALSTTQQYLQVKDSLPIRRLEASLYRRMGNSPQAIAILTQMMQTPPFNPEVAYDLCDADWNADHFADGLEVCRQLLEHHYDTSFTYWLQARCQYSLKLYKDSRQSLEAALKRDPANKDARDLLTVVNSALAEKKSR